MRKAKQIIFWILIPTVIIISVLCGAFSRYVFKGPYHSEAGLIVTQSGYYQTNLSWLSFLFVCFGYLAVPLCHDKNISLCRKFGIIFATFFFSLLCYSFAFLLKFTVTVRSFAPSSIQARLLLQPGRFLLSLAVILLLSLSSFLISEFLFSLGKKTLGKWLWFVLGTIGLTLIPYFFSLIILKSIHIDNYDRLFIDSPFVLSGLSLPLFIDKILNFFFFQREPNALIPAFLTFQSLEFVLGAASFLLLLRKEQIACKNSSETSSDSPKKHKTLCR